MRNIYYRRIINRMGYYNYQNSMIYRHLNQGEGWNSHLERCRNFILKALDLNPFRAGIQKKHIDFLLKHNSLLITDYSEVFTSRSGVISTIPTLVTELPPGKVTEEWVWDFDQACSDYYNRRSLLKIAAMVI